MVPIYRPREEFDPQAKSRPVLTLQLDLHALGITHLEGEPIQQYVTLPDVEPGTCLQVVLGGYGGAVLLHDGGSLLPAPVVLICDTAGERGQIADAVLLG